MDFEKKDYLFVLRAMQEIPFGVGRKLLIDFLLGVEENESIRRHKLKDLPTFGALAYSRGEVNAMIGTLLVRGMLTLQGIDDNPEIKVLRLTEKGKREIDQPTLGSRADITDKDKELFETFDFFLSSYNDEQKKAIISPSKTILCIAGAGSGKTTVLTKRIEFLIRFRSFDPGKILAITFTRKARQEMMKRLKDAGIAVQVETFNSFCEKVLKTNAHLIYDRPFRVMSYADKIRLFKQAMSKLGISPSEAISIYFNDKEIKGKTDDQMLLIFMNDCYFARDFTKVKGELMPQSNVKAFSLVYRLCEEIDSEMQRQGLRDYSDQLLDAIKLFSQHPEAMPSFDHLLVDEYQDVNATQIQLIAYLNPNNLFAVGDPRQSIYGWRGSDVSFIMQFEDYHKDCEIINLVRNYRSERSIVKLINKAITQMRLPDLVPAIEVSKDLRLLGFASEDAEREFIIQRILSANIKRNEIFVLARTNKQLEELSQAMKARGIKHVVKAEDNESIIALDDDVMLATVHAIKGLEAEMVFVMGCSPNYFPCKASEHPVTEMLKLEYDKHEEERRLLYVAMSRAKKSLYLSYTGKSPSPFITREMTEIIDPSHETLSQATLFDYSYSKASRDVIAKLQDWRREKSRELGVPAFMVMHDKTLFEIAEKKPLLEEDLREITGLGPAKIRRFGDEIISVISR